MTLEEENKQLRILLTSAYRALHIAANAYREECSGKSLCGLCDYEPPCGTDYPCECPGFYRSDCFRWHFTDKVISLIFIKEDKKE